MSEENKEILREAALTQTIISKALGQSQSSVSIGLNSPTRFFIERRNKLILKYLKQHHPDKVEIFEKLVSYDASRASTIFPSKEVSKILDTNDINDLWWISSSPYFLLDRKSLHHWLEGLITKDFFMFFLLPSLNSVIEVFSAIQALCNPESELTIQFAYGDIASLSPDLLLINPNSALPKIYVRDHDEQFTRLSEFDVNNFVKNLNSLGLAGLHGEFYSHHDTITSHITTIEVPDIQNLIKRS